MGTKGTVFDVRQFSVFDGYGIRTTVFLKGCPLRCQWCHNPEGLAFHPQLLVNRNACTHCGKCETVCPMKDNPTTPLPSTSCRQCGTCIRACPRHLRRMCGREWDAGELADLLLEDREYFAQVKGGVTFSGGEPLAQPDFLLDVLERLDGVDKAVETSGFCSSSVFQSIAARLDLVQMDLKLMDPDLHLHYTGQSNSLILENLAFLKRGSLPFIIRIPLIPGVTDTMDNLVRTADILEDAKSLVRVELLPYHYTAGAKYNLAGRIYVPEFDVSRKPDANPTFFTDRGIPCVLF